MAEEERDEVLLAFEKDGPAWVSLAEALQSALPDDTTLSRLVRRTFSESAPQLAGDDIRSMHEKLIAWAVSRGEILTLIAAVQDDNPGNPRFRKFLSAYPRYRDAALVTAAPSGATTPPSGASAPAVVLPTTPIPASTSPVPVTDIAQFRQPMTEGLSRPEVGILWFDLFGTLLDDEQPGRSHPECVIALLMRVKQRGRLPALLDSLQRLYPHVLQSATP